MLHGLFFSSCGSSCCGAWALLPTDLSSAAPGLESPGPAAVMHGLSCSATCGLPRPGVELMSPALAGGKSLPLSCPASPQAYFRLVFHAPIWWERPESQESSATVLALPSKALGPPASACPALSRVWLLAHQAPLSMGFPRQDYWSGLPFPSPWGDFLNKQIIWWTEMTECLVPNSIEKSRVS